MDLEKILKEIEKMDDDDRIEVVHKALDLMDIPAYAIVFVMGPDGGMWHYEIKEKDEIRKGYVANELEETLEKAADTIRWEVWKKK